MISSACPYGCKLGEPTKYGWTQNIKQLWYSLGNKQYGEPPVDRIIPKIGWANNHDLSNNWNDPINWWRHSKVFVRSGHVVMLWVDGWGVTNCDSLRCILSSTHFSVQRTTTFVVPSADCSHQQKDLFCVVTWVPWLSIYTLHGRGWPLKTTHEHNKRANGKTDHHFLLILCHYMFTIYQRQCFNWFPVCSLLPGRSRLVCPTMGTLGWERNGFGPCVLLGDTQRTSTVIFCAYAWRCRGEVKLLWPTSKNIGWGAELHFAFDLSCKMGFSMADCW